MDAYNWLMQKLNKKYMKLHFLIMAVVAIAILYGREENILLFYSMTMQGFIVMTNELYYQKYLDNNCVSLYILQNNAKRMVVKYQQNMMMLISVPLLLLTGFVGMNRIEEIEMVCMFLFWSFAVNAFLVVLKFSISAKLVKCIEFVLLAGTSVIAVINMIWHQLSFILLVMLLLGVLGLTSRFFRKISKERLARFIL